MAYLQSSGGEPIPHDQILIMAEAVGLTIPPEDLEPLSTAIRDQLASVDQLRTLDLTGIGPSLKFDPRWHD